MFTGIIEEIGKIDSVQRDADSTVFHIAAGIVIKDLKVDHSVSVAGCCLTVTDLDASGFVVRAVKETLGKTTLGDFREGAHVNLERAMKLSDRLGGHLVQGHVDATGTVHSVTHLDQGVEMWISYPKRYSAWVVPAGSICVNGVSLTIAELSVEKFKVALIPHTLVHTTFGDIGASDKVNLEFDMIAKYIETVVARRQWPS
ncbi:MAG: riboflavin synthase [Ignavibacteria bacterium]|nr:riboflavin synthase [Ignavibacteria bacterium]